jgi:hypothetical protein
LAIVGTQQNEIARIITARTPFGFTVCVLDAGAVVVLADRLRRMAFLGLAVLPAILIARFQGTLRLPSSQRAPLPRQGL